MIKYYRDGNNVVCYDEENKKIVEIIPIYEADGKTYTKDFREVCKKMNSPKKEVETPVTSTSKESTQIDEQPEEVVEEPSVIERVDDDDVEVISPEETSLVPVQKGELATTEQPSYRIINETPDKKGLKGKGKYLLAGITLGALIGGCIFALTRDGKKIENGGAIPPSTEPTQEATKTPEATPTPSLEELKEDSRYTEITEDILVGKTQNLIEEFRKNGIEINGEDALIFVTVANITHLQKTNPELLVKVLGEDAEAENVIAKAYSIMGNIITLYVSPKQNHNVDWTIAFIDEQDRKIAKHYVEQVLNGSLTIAHDDTMKHEDKKSQIQNNIINNYVIPIYDNTAAYTATDGTKFYGPQEDGAEFISTIIMSAILQPDFGTLISENTKQPAFIDGEVLDDINEILKNADTSPVIMRIIEGCKSVDIESKGKTK